MSNRTSRRRLVWIVILIVVLVSAGWLVLRARGRNGERLAEADLPLRCAPAEVGEVKVRLNEVGTIEPVVKVDVKSTISGKVVELLVREGEAVETGQVLARVEPDVNQAQEFSSVRSREKRSEISFSDAKREYDNQKRLFEEGLTSRDALRQAEAAYRQAEEDSKAATEQVAIAVESGIPLREVIRTTQRFNVVSPMKGTVIARPVEVGETIMSGVSSFNAGTVLFTVADVGAMQIKADVNEVDIGKIRLGQKVTVDVDAFPFQHYGGTITFISPAARTLERVKVFGVEVTLDEQRPEFRPGMTANITIQGESKEGVLAVPTESLFQREGRDVVFVLRPDFGSRAPKDFRRPARGKADISFFWKELFEVRPVRVGLSSAERVEILEGLSAGEKVALDDPAKPPPEED